MSLRLNPYPDYKDSGLPWLGAIPEHWKLLRTKYVFREVDERSTTGEETHLSMSQKYGLIESSQIDEWRLQSESYIGAKLCKTNDLVLNRLKAHLGVFAHAPLDGIVSPDYTVLRVMQDNEPRFLENIFRTPTYIGELKRSTKGIVEGFWRLYTDDLYDIRVPVPPVKEQKAILDWIDMFDRTVRRLILAKQQLIELLNEQKQAIVHSAVTRGLNPNAPTKSTNHNWPPEVPEHWEVRRLRSCFSSVMSGLWGDDPSSSRVDDHVVCVRVADFHIDSLSVSDSRLTLRSVPRHIRQNRLLLPGDLLIEKSGGGDAEPVGRVVMFNLNREAIFSNFVLRIRPTNNYFGQDSYSMC